MRLRVLSRLLGDLSGAILGDAAGNGEADKGHEAAEKRERQQRQARNDAEHRHQ